MAKRADIIREARTWLGTRFRHQGRVKGEACDCSGLCFGVARALGIEVGEFTAYGVLPVPDEMERQLDARLDRVARGEERPGDIAWMRHPRRGSDPRHLAILAGPTCLRTTRKQAGNGGRETVENIIHADSDRKQVVEHRFSGEWRRRVKRYYRYRGLDD